LASVLLASTLAKIDRAKKHLGELTGEIGAFHARNPYRIMIDKDSKPGHELHRVRFLEDIPVSWGTIVGDVLHNLRSSLDNLASALVVANGRTGRNVINDAQFPIASSELGFQKSLAALKGVSAEAKRVIERLKPYQGGTDAFWRLHRLDNLDKHTVLIPVGASHTSILWKFNTLPGFEAMFADKGGLPADFVAPELPPMILTPANFQFPLKDGDVIFDYGLGPDTEGKRKGDFQFTIDIAFGEGQVIDGQPVVPSLQQFIDFVERVVDIFARHAFPK